MGDTYDVNKHQFPSNTQGTWPPSNAKVLTPSATLDVTSASGDNLPHYLRGVQIGNTAGNLVVVMAGQKDDTITVTFPVAANQVYPYQIRRVLATSTAATIVGLFD